MARPIDKLKVNDPRVERQYATINGHRWSYLDAIPSGPPKGTIVLIHGFPDLSLAWRYQIPLFLSLGFRCIALDCMGYSHTSASADLSAFSFKSHAEAVAGIAQQLGVQRVILGGHDWGGITVYRVAQWFPDLVSHVFSVCTAFVPVTGKFVSSEWLVKTTIPQFGYQLQFGSEDGQLEGAIKDEKSMRKFLKGMYGGKPSSQKRFMDPKVGIDLEMVKEGHDFGMTPLLDEEELDFYVQEFLRNGIRGPCNWYRTRKINWEEEQTLPEEQKTIIRQPTLYILATKDDVLTRDMAAGMEKVVPNLTRGEVPAGHWALWQTPAMTNKLIEEWLVGVVLGGKAKL